MIDPLAAFNEALETAEHYADEATEDPELPARYAGAFVRIAEHLKTANGNHVRVTSETWERLEWAALEDESFEDVIQRHLSTLPGPNEWACTHCGDPAAAPGAHHETNDLVIWQLAVEASDHYRPDAFCSQRCFREHLADLAGTEAQR
ncbi:hypothetical protein [Haloglomus litoreum]|uniref:hypothetical protein n=1 Tax=Haloglomus litoreum TaxID=3034026 RepID=UPI0023E86AF2|nr:hypothetical protein [Haloglomus sp. DT116]